MISTKRAVENSLYAISVKGDESVRLAEIQAVTNPFKRAGLRGLHKLVAQFPEMAANRLGMEYWPAGLQQIGEGRQSVVYRVAGEGTVLKVVKEHDSAYNPVVFSRSERRRQASQMHEQHTAMVDYLGPLVVPHEISVGRHPINRGQEAIRITQPYCDIDYLELSNEEEAAGIDRLIGHLRQVRERSPAVIPQLSSIVSNSRVMAQECQLVTDIVGSKNSGIDGHSGLLVIVDSQPVPPERPPEQALALRHLDRLEAALAGLAIAA